MHRPASIHLLTLLLILLSLGALVCGALLIIRPDGSLLQLPLDSMAYMPFADFLVPGLFLFTCLGLLPAVAATALMPVHPPAWAERVNIYRGGYRGGWMLALFSGFATLIWITVQHRMAQHYHALQTVYAVVGLLILVLAVWPASLRWCRQGAIK
jgi:hypothetical protein